MRLILGGPSYQMQVDARHAGSMASLALRLRELGRLEWIQFHWSHGCPVEHARNNLFAQALATNATHLLWVDSDCYWSSAENDGIAWMLEQLRGDEGRETPFIAIPVHQRNGACNIVKERKGPRFERFAGKVTMEAKLHDCIAAGTGVCGFFLPWYRSHWKHAPWFRTDWEHGEMISEDFWHTNRLLMKHGVPPRWAPVVQVIHAARGAEAAR